MIDLYTRDGCAHCERAKRLLTGNNIAFNMKQIGVDIDRDSVLELFSNNKTLPIIVLDGEPLGSIEELQTLIFNGQI